MAHNRFIAVILLVFSGAVAGGTVVLSSKPSPQDQADVVTLEPAASKALTAMPGAAEPLPEPVAAALLGAALVGFATLLGRGKSRVPQPAREPVQETVPASL